MPENSIGTASTRWEQRRRLRTVLLVLIVATLPCYCLGWVALSFRDRLVSGNATPTPTETPLATASPTLTPYLTLTLAPTATRTISPLPSLTSTNTATATITLSPTASPLPSVTYTLTATATFTPLPTATATASLTPAPPVATFPPTQTPSGGITGTAPPP